MSCWKSWFLDVNLRTKCPMYDGDRWYISSLLPPLQKMPIQPVQDKTIRIVNRTKNRQRLTNKRKVSAHILKHRVQSCGTTIVSATAVTVYLWTLIGWTIFFILKYFILKFHPQGVAFFFHPKRETIDLWCCQRHDGQKQDGTHRADIHT